MSHKYFFKGFTLVKIFRIAFILFSTLLLFSFALHASNVYAQDVLNREHDIRFKDVGIKEALNFISKKFDVSFNYTGNSLSEDTKVDINTKKISLKAALDKILEGSSLTYIVFNGDIIIRPLKNVSKEKHNTRNNATDSSVVRGQVIDSLTEEPLQGVTIQIENSNRGTTTESDGSFQIKTSGKETLIISYLGYRTKNVSLDDKTRLSIALVSSSTALDQLVVVGYGTSLKKDLTTSIGSVNSDQLEERPNAINMFQGMAGKVAGVNIMLNSGAPGGNPSIKIRGTGSINSSNNPLYVVDGVVGVDPNIINLNTVKSIDVLKDAAAASIYGSRGANGVVVITTKEGKKNATNISYASTLSVGSLAREVDVLDAKKSLEVFKRAYEYKSGRLAPHLDPNNKFPYKEDLFNSDGSPKYNTDWQKAVTRTAFSHKHSLTFSGGSDKLTAFANLSYTDNQGIMLNTYQKKYNAFVNIGWDLKKWFHLQGMLNVGSIKKRNSEDNISRYALEGLPFLPVKYPDGTYSRKGDYPGAEDAENPVKILKQREDLDNEQYTLANVTGRFQITQDLKLNVNFSKQIGANMNSFYAPSTLFGYGETQNGRAERTNNRYSAWTNEDYLTFDKKLREHHLNVVIGASWYYRQNTSTVAGAEDFFDDFFKYNNMGVGTVRSEVGSGYDDNKMNSYYARVNYNYADRYLLGASFREDGSSRFGQNNKYGFFPSFSAAWRISNESFFENIKHTIDDLKLRATYGVVGNAEIGDYVTLGRLSNALLPFNKKLYPAVTLQGLGNPDLQWEKSQQLDLGLSMSLFSGRIEMVADYYKKTTTNLLYSVQLPVTTGYESTMTNLGKIRNKGLELTLNTRNIQSKEFLWSTNFNYTMNRSMVVDINGDIINEWGGRIQEGKPLNMLFGYVRLGTWGTDEVDEAAKYNKEPGDIKYWDRNGNGKKDGDDQTFLGNAMPKFDMNLNNSFSYKGFTLLLDLHWMYGNQLINFTKQLMGNRVTFSNSYTEILKEAWTPENQGGMIASLRLPGDGYENEVDSWSCEPGSFLRVRNIGLKYQIPDRFLSRISIKSMSVGFNVTNALLFTKYSGSDPEVTSFDADFNQGIDFYSYPKPRTFVFTLNVDF